MVRAEDDLGNVDDNPIEKMAMAKSTAPVDSSLKLAYTISTVGGLTPNWTATLGDAYANPEPRSNPFALGSGETLTFTYNPGGYTGYAVLTNVYRNNFV